MRNTSQWLAYCCLAVLVALYVVGAVSNGSLRHEVQTLPLWFPIVQGFRQREVTKWSALPCLIFWLVIMVLIWLFLLGWAHVVSGHFSMTEIVMTLVIGVACVVGTVRGFLWRTTVRPMSALGVTVLFGILQVLALRISLIPHIATR